jgi:hypothetical protein
MYGLINIARSWLGEKMGNAPPMPMHSESVEPLRFGNVPCMEVAVVIPVCTVCLAGARNPNCHCVGMSSDRYENDLYDRVCEEKMGFMYFGTSPACRGDFLQDMFNISLHGSSTAALHRGLEFFRHEVRLVGLPEGTLLCYIDDGVSLQDELRGKDWLLAQPRDASLLDVEKAYAR